MGMVSEPEYRAESSREILTVISMAYLMANLTVNRYLKSNEDAWAMIS